MKISNILETIYEKSLEIIETTFGIVLGLVPFVFIGSIAYFSCNREDSNQQDRSSSSYKYEDKCVVTHGDYDDFIKLRNSIYPCPDSLSKQDSVDKNVANLENLQLIYRHEDDSLVIVTTTTLEVCYLVLHADINDTLNSKCSNWHQYIYRLSEHNISYSELEKITLAYGSSVEDHERLILSKKEFEEAFPHLVPYLKLRKARKSHHYTTN